MSPIALFTDRLCSYSGGEETLVAAGSGSNRTWLGPLDSGGFYATGTGPNPLLTDGAMPADGKVNLSISGSITIEDSNTQGPGNGGDDLVSGTLIIAAGERSANTSDGTALESFISVTHTIPATVVSSASDNATGGFDYVIGSEGFPLLLSSALDDYPSEMASDTGASEINVWDQANGGNIPVVNPPPSGPPPEAQGPYTVEIVSYSPGSAVGGNVEPNIGVATTAAVDGLTCEDGDGAGNSTGDCATSTATWSVSGAEFDNLILRISTNSDGKVISANAFYTLEYAIFGFVDSFIGGTLEFAGVPEAIDDDASTSSDMAVDIDVLGNDFQFSDPVTVSLPGMGVSSFGGTVTVNGANPGAQGAIDITYTPPAGFSGVDTFDYTVADISATDSATVTVTVTGGGPGNIFPIAPDVGVNTGESESIDIIVNALPGVSLGNTPVTIAIVSDPSSGTTSLFGQVITYTPVGYPSSDAFDYEITDADGDSATGTISVSIGPPLVPTANPDSRRMLQDSSIDISVIENDVPGSGAVEEHSVSITSEPISGTATVNADNTVTFLPDPGVSGVSTFSYQLTDANMDVSAPALVTIEVEALPVDARLPVDNSSAISPWSLLALAALMWLRTRRGFATEPGS
ncbi:MAG: hypothetical protein KJO76_09600 [Gammaproteobacteria bacterium]|nr:hypothetical protein [Gammaproteobacteria bacterium]